ncbi:hypothetical protein JHK85_005358 [Glycine max]|uniref:Uncharacterized protein n=1 Tax=Glycine max TaxID=3847 RepID=A0A0R0L7C1_SOYBN|nr:hypothetical protein JHK85_005358 [Glycine max]KAG5081126.1 hypothetical protein JHK86_005191 [Glycine max]KAH1061739.1 hypothetical protein GYH30_004975 [Glycine max]
MILVPYYLYTLFEMNSVYNRFHDLLTEFLHQLIAFLHKLTDSKLVITNFWSIVEFLMCNPPSAQVFWCFFWVCYYGPQGVPRVCLLCLRPCCYQGST